ncbi:MAG: DUF222 domain-containing protein [Marmoricola sp.]
MANPTTTAAAPHRLIRFADSVGHALDEVAELDPMFATPADKRAALIGLRRVQDRITALGLKVLAAAEDVALDTGHRDATAWLADVTRHDPKPVIGDLELGRALGTRWVRLGQALAAGSVNLAQARVITQILDDLPSDLPARTVARAEEHMTGLAATHRPQELRNLGRHLLHVIDPAIADVEDAKRLEAEERRARETTRCDLKRLGDGSTRITVKVPDAVADRFRTYLDAYTSPRHGTGPEGTGPVEVAGVPEADRIPAARKRGLAFAALLEHLDPQRLPEHGGDATTVMVTVSLQALRAELATAGVITSDSGDISASEARRLACTAHVVPAVLGSQGQILDLGRATRLFTPAQRKALRLRDGRCRAEGCTIPATWTEAHHWEAWSAGGRTDLANGVSLCNWHHHRAHDHTYRHQRLSNGDVRFSRRT